MSFHWTVFTTLSTHLCWLSLTILLTCTSSTPAHTSSWRRCCHLLLLPHKQSLRPYLASDTCNSLAALQFLPAQTSIPAAATLGSQEFLHCMASLVCVTIHSSTRPLKGSCSSAAGPTQQHCCSSLAGLAILANSCWSPFQRLPQFTYGTSSEGTEHIYPGLEVIRQPRYVNLCEPRLKVSAGFVNGSVCAASSDYSRRVSPRSWLAVQSVWLMAVTHIVVVRGPPLLTWPPYSWWGQRGRLRCYGSLLKPVPLWCCRARGKSHPEVVVLIQNKVTTSNHRTTSSPMHSLLLLGVLWLPLNSASSQMCHRSSMVSVMWSGIISWSLSCPSGAVDSRHGLVCGTACVLSPALRKVMVFSLGWRLILYNDKNVG